MNRSFVFPVAGLVYIALVRALGGLRSDHVMIGLLGFLDLYNEKSRLFLRSFFPLILTGVIYDSMRYFYWAGVRGRVHVIEPFQFDLTWFGIGGLTPNEFFERHHWPILDVLCGFAYLVYVGEYLLAALYLFLTEKWSLLRVFGLSFLTVNLLGFATYFIYPAAPPWYVSQFGFGPARWDVRASPAAAHRFDLLFGTNFFDHIYARGVDVFGAYPSLHVAYPLLVAWVTFQLPELKLARIPAIAFYLLVCFSAVYLQHHYVADVLIGTLYTIATVPLVRKLLHSS